MTSIQHVMIPNSEAVRVGDLIFFGGIVARDETSGIFAPFEVERQTKRIIERIDAYLRSEGLSLASLVSVTVYLPDIRLYDLMNAAYSMSFSESLPTRKVIVSPLTVSGAVVEMTAIASAIPRRILEL